MNRSRYGHHLPIRPRTGPRFTSAPTFASRSSARFVGTDWGGASAWSNQAKTGI